MIDPPGFDGYVSEYRMSPGLEAGGFLFLTGMTGFDMSSGHLPESDALQIEAAFGRVDVVLNAAGLDWRAVVEMTSYHVGLRDHIATFREIRERFVRAPFPAWTAIGVTELITPGTIVELRAIARRDVP